ncbi:hypothetical protein AU468_05055 [Alkalispirochaeta sphaeroplastigenens]|uniref:Uncharacterized protein n=1 Tax=Alkalispirochaeta sphaeroplastigenens TaxID=1187066 RepID=A0A2S4JVU8_9SPIO|nr:hypothetical protein [Alkalispirochaeta sphaeroplastigenens]POR03616.1 hypothetical protein AU468_05055 [Alkalispirochaeta sphaeroplastigenens]
MKRYIWVGVIFLLAGGVVFPGGIFERSSSRRDETPVEAKDPSGEVDGEGEVQDAPLWVQLLQEGKLRELQDQYPGSIVGVGQGQNRQQAEAAAAVDFAGNLSTEVSASVVDREVATPEGTDFLQKVESEVRSQAVISGIRPEAWRHPASGIWYAKIRTTHEEYRAKLAEWARTMAEMGEAERERQLQALRDEEARVVQRQKEIELDKMREQVRLADRRMRAERHREFLDHSLMSRERRLPTGYLPEAIEINLAYTGSEDERAADFSVDKTVLRLFLVGLDGQGVYDTDESDLAVELTGRAMVQVLSRAGLVTSTTIGLGGFGRASLGGAKDREWDEEGSWLAGPFVVVDILIPALLHTRYSLYAGTDYAQARVGWYPFWWAIQEAVGVHLAATYDVDDDDAHWGAGLAFRPAEAIRIFLESENLSYLRGGITFSY